MSFVCSISWMRDTSVWCGYKYIFSLSLFQRSRAFLSKCIFHLISRARANKTWNRIVLAYWENFASFFIYVDTDVWFLHYIPMMIRLQVPSIHFCITFTSDITTPSSAWWEDWSNSFARLAKSRENEEVLSKSESVYYHCNQCCTYNCL